MAVYEVWGDLLFEAYEPASQHTHTIYAPLTLMVSALSDEPDTLKLYLAAGPSSDLVRDQRSSLVTTQ